MEEKKLENIEEVTEEVAEDAEEVTEEITEEIKEEEAIEDMLEEKEEDPYASVSQELDIPKYQTAKKQHKPMNIGIISLVLAIIIALSSVAYVGYSSYDAYQEKQKVYADNSFDEVYKEKIVELRISVSQEYAPLMSLKDAVPNAYDSYVRKFFGKSYEELANEIYENERETIEEYFELNYDAEKVKWEVSAEKEIFKPARDKMTEEIVEASAIGLLLLAIAYILFLDYKKRNN